MVVKQHVVAEELRQVRFGPPTPLLPNCRSPFRMVSGGKQLMMELLPFLATEAGSFQYQINAFLSMLGMIFTA